MKKGFLLIFLVFAVIFTFPIGLMLTSPFADDIPFFGVLIFIFVDLVFWGIFFAQIVKLIRTRKIEKNGTEFTATFVSYASNMSVNNVPMFYITYVWENDNGERKEGKSASEYTIHEVEAFERAKKFKIKAIGNKSIIIATPSLLVADFNEDLINEGKAICEYCSSVFDATQNKCSHCGAPRGE